MALNRRELLSFGGAFLASFPGSLIAKPVPPVVLVHGAWHGSWCWKRVEARLLAAGHTVFAPTLTGLAERAHLLSPQVNLTTHIEDVASVLEFEELSGAVLVGHSYGGLVVSGVASRLPKRIGRLVYLDAFVPAHGQTGFDLMKPAYAASWKKKAAGTFKVPPMLDAKAMGVTDAVDAAWVDRKLTPHPLASFEEKLELDAAALGRLPRAYLRCAGFPGFGPTAERVRKEGFEVKELPCGHDAMIAAPEALAEMLHGLG
jgi:pimeloyl-ACP methyl ester carboxylesterase